MKRLFATIFFVLLLLAFLLGGCRSSASKPTVSPLSPLAAPVLEQPVSVIPLAGDLADSNAEVSGLAWYGQTLVLLPQYPDRFRSGGHGQVFVLPKSHVLAFLDGQSSEPLQPRAIPLLDASLVKGISGFEGYEAIAFFGEQVFVAIEARSGGRMLGYLARGHIATDLSRIELEAEPLAEVTAQTTLSNMAYETLLLSGNSLITMYEANGLNVNSEPVAYRFDLSLAPLDAIPFPNLEYRITDATDLDEANHFWAINYFWPGDAKLEPAPDSLAARFGQGETHARFETVERLVQLSYTPSGISLTAAPPIQLQLIDDDHSRNWEGVVRLDERGFLLVTDKHPETILGFVPYP
jgi:hypothetical protein